MYFRTLCVMICSLVFGCTDAAPMSGCDLDAHAIADASLDVSSDVGGGDAVPDVADSSQGDGGGVAVPPFNMIVRVFPERGKRQVGNLRLQTISRGRLRLMQMVEEQPYFGSGEYSPALARVVNVENDHLTLQVTWTSVKNDTGDTADVALVTADSATGLFTVRGEIRVTDSYEREWVGYPALVDGAPGVWLTFRPGPCESGTRQLRSGLCSE